MKKFAGKALAAILLPVSAVPIALAAPQVVSSYRSWDRSHEAGPFAAAPVRLTAGERALERLPSHPRAVPVLSYRGVGTGPGRVTRAQLGHQLGLLRRLGYRSLSADEYVRFLRGESRLPERPVLITFDRGRLSTYRQADRLLAGTGMRAVIFVETARIQSKDPKYLRWNELKDMQASKRWDVQTYGHQADRPITVDGSGRSAPFYSARRYTNSGGLETLADFEQRATLDVFQAKKLLRAHGLHPLLFALPDPDYSRKTTNDARALALVKRVVARQFSAQFSQTDRSPGFGVKGDAAPRLLVDRQLDSRALYRWLRARNPALERRAERDVHQRNRT